MWVRALSTVFALLAVRTSAGVPSDQQIEQSRKLKFDDDLWSIAYTRCKCSSTPRPCLFIHGESHGKEQEELQTSSNMFGDMSKHAPCCSTIKFASLDTLTVGWTDEKLQEKVCNFSLSMSNSSDTGDRVIKDTVLVTHSMGALILAGAVANEKCSLHKSTKWVSMSAPMKGTMVSNYAQDICSNDDTQAFRQMLRLIGQCPVGNGMKSLAYMGGKYSTVKLNNAYEDAQKVYRKHVSAAMCSSSNVGILSTYQVQYLRLGAAAKHGTGAHDGVVTFESCRGGLKESQFSPNPDSLFYVTSCNHADTAFLNGNSLMIDSMKPLQWFECLL